MSVAAKGKTLPKMGKELPMNRHRRSTGYASVVKEALAIELGGSNRAIKTVMRWTGASVHMAFLSTLAALLEDSRLQGLVNLPRLLGRLNDQQTRTALAARRRIDPREFYRAVVRLQERYRDHLAPLIPRVEDIRNNVVAHHGATTVWPATTIGVLRLTMVRVVVLIDALHDLMTGAPTNIRENILAVRYQSASLWSAGIDGDPSVRREPLDEAGEP